jgi:outer membrane receptor protein involved in Fe transport
MQDVPVPVAVLNGETLAQMNQLRLQDYFNQVPGLSLTTDPNTGAADLAIRGIPTSSSGEAAVAVLIDDVPYGTPLGGIAINQPDIDPSDLARVEVLRGPQGTLYGVSSLGGLLKFVTVEPSTEKFSGRVELGTGSVFNGDSLGYTVRGSVNVPVNDTVAIRASAFGTQVPGYIDNIETGEQGVNRRTSDGGRLALLWKLSDAWSLKLSAMAQDSKRDGAAVMAIAPGFGDLQTRSLPNTQTVESKNQAYSATLKGSFGAVQLTSLTGFNVDQLNTYDDTTRILPDSTGLGFWDGLANQYLHTTGPGSAVVDSSTVRNFSQELRLSVPLGDRITWLLGGYYTHEKAALVNENLGANPNTGAPTADYFLGSLYDKKYEEYAVFTDITYKITDRLDVQLGGRKSEARQDFVSYWSGAAAAPFGLFSAPNVEAKDHPFTYLFTPRFKLTPDTMVYARLASGYRPGGTNSICGFAGVSCSFGPEKTENYEFGFKGDFIDHRLSFDTSIFRINWTDIQVSLTATGPGGITANYQSNAGTAKSQGVEFSVGARPVEGLTIAAWVTWTDAIYTATLPPSAAASVGGPGERIPFVSRFSGHISADQNFAVGGPLTAFVGGAVSYVGDRLGYLQPVGVARAELPGYAQVDARGGLKYDAWTFTAFVTNLADKRGLLAGGVDYQYANADPNTYAVIQPRTFGLSVSRTF